MGVVHTVGFSPKAVVGSWVLKLDFHCHLPLSISGSQSSSEEKNGLFQMNKIVMDKNHRIIESFRLEGISGNQQVQSPSQGKASFKVKFNSKVRSGCLGSHEVEF